MKQWLLFLPILLLFLSCFSSCLKKGEDDPLISFRTRKARIVGEWKMVHGYIVQTDNIYTNTSTFTSDSFEEIRSSQSGTYLSTGEAKFTLVLEKNGKAVMQQNLNGNGVTGLTGTWNFTGNIGDKKKKEQLVLQQEKMSYIPNIIYEIRELRHKKLVLTRKFGYAGYNYEENFEFQPK